MTARRLPIGRPARRWVAALDRRPGVRSRATTPSAKAISQLNSSIPTATTHDPALLASTANRAASDTAPQGPPTETVDPRATPPPGSSSAKAATTGSFCWDAKLTGAKLADS